MSVKTRNLALFSAALAVALLLAATFSACESTLGFGKAIDFVLPELTLDPGPNPQYVTYTSTISGKITDDIAVDRVELREADTGKKLFTATLSGSGPREKRFSMVMDFREVTLELKSGTKTGDELNGERIGVEIVGYDKAGNSHIAAITLIIDMREPFTTDINIERTSEGNKRTALLEPLFPNEKEDGLKILETDDPKGERSENANRYQNGRFTIKAKLDENETRIKDDDEKTVRLKLNIYDEANQNEPLLSLKRDAGSSIFSPVWSLLDENIIQAGKTKGWTNYTNNAYYNGKRFYYNVEVVAIDESGNELHDYMGWFCMWQDGDIPKGVLDPNFAGDGNAVSYVDRGESLPVVFFDDDAIEYAYAGLLTKAQWEGQKIDDHGDVENVYIAPPDVQMPQFTNLPVAERDDAKLEWLRDRFRNDDPVYNWYFDIHSSTTDDNGKSVAITATVDSPATDTYEEIVYIETGNRESDYGEFVLFTLTADRKLPPHKTADFTGPIATLKPQWKGRAWQIQVIDSNAPLIVFDTVDTTLGPDDYDPAKHPGNDLLIPEAATGNSPEENTFPRLSDGRFFEINGYTLRENGNGHNSVTVFRAAWIPYNIKDETREGPDAFIAQVQNALASPNYPDPDPLVPDSEWPAGVQHWELHNSETNAPYHLIEGTPQPINGIDFRKQVFRKKFDVLGGPDNLKPEYLNFTYEGELENETKVLVFYAKDNARHGVFRQLRLLSNKTPPEITVYDLTSRGIAITEGAPSGLPDLNNPNSSDGQNYYFFNTSTGLIDTDGRGRYEARRLWYQPTGFNLLKTSITNTPLSSGEEASTNAAYPRETIIKYWVVAKSNGDLAVDDIRMYDITFSNNLNMVGEYDKELSLSYIEKVSEITQRVFLFEATDSLNNTARIQRTVAVTNAAVLNSITTSTQTGSYGIGTEIILHANFTNLVRWTGTNPPLLNVRYNYQGTQVIRQIPTSTLSGQASLSLDFPITVMPNDRSILETMYFGIGNSNGNTVAGTEAAKNNRPITIPDGTLILDFTRGDEAFTPRNSAGFDWTTNKGSLQEIKNPTTNTKLITMQGVRPTISSFVLNPPVVNNVTKTQYTDNPNQGYYYKADETIEFTLTANNPIFTSGSPIIEFLVGANTTYRTAAWVRSSGPNAMVFSVLVNSANTPEDGTVSGIRLRNVSTIVDSVGNAFAAGTSWYNTNINISGNNTIRIDKTAPAAPGTTLAGNPLGTVTAGSTTNTLNFNQQPLLTIPANTSGESAPVARTQYSLNNGVTWREFAPTFEADSTWISGTPGNNLRILNGQWTLVTRYIDRAGNPGATTSQPLHINAIFPNLIAVGAVQANGWYKAGANLSFTLDFADAVNVNTGSEAQVQIVLTNRGSAATTDGSGNNNMILQAATGQTSITRTGNTSITFNWTVATNSKEMRNGMYISRINLTGLRDRFGNQVTTPAANIDYNASTTAPSPIGPPFVVTTPASTINNLGVTISNNVVNAVKVDAINPIRSSTNPATGGVSSYPGTDTNGADRRNVITLTFNEPVIKGNGVITIQPRGNFLVPPVFDDTGYYINCETEAPLTEEQVAHPTNFTNRKISIPGFYDIYNSGLTAAQRNALTAGTTEASQRATANASVIPSSAPDPTNPSMTRLQLDSRTGQPVGPYVKTTHGLKAGYGYSGNYSGNRGTAEVFGPNTEDGHTNNYALFEAMVPDTSTKWVLRYNLGINDATGDAGTAITGIRGALEAAKFRWQEIEVGWDNVTIGTPAANGQTVVSIRLSEPLLQGLQWTLSYPAGTFTDEAGNNAPVLAADSYTFWSQGVRKPVIRVDRKSYDARDAAWHAPRTGANDSSSFTYAEPASGSAWHIDAFNNVAYRIESETPGATINYGVTGRNNSITGVGSGPYNAVTVNGTTTTVTQPNPDTGTNNYTTVGISGTIWDGSITAAGADYTATTWNASNATRNTFWVKPNLLRKFGRSGNYADRSAQIVNGDQRRSSGALSVLHSYNADATSTILENLSLTTGTAGQNYYASTVDFGQYEAGKRYVVATARITNGGITYDSKGRGYEGVFRTLIVLNGQRGNRSYNGNAQNNAAGINKILVGGSNVKSGTPSIPGFPLLDGAETGDARFVKMMYNVDYHDNTHTNGTGGKRFYWVSTEIVCEFYMAYFGNGGNTQRTGDVNNYLMVNYGDLSYAYQLDRFPDN